MNVRHRRRGTGFTLVEMAVAVGAAATLLALAWPTFRDQLAQARRADATLALERIQFAQERHHALHGHYARSLHDLSSPQRTSEGLYDVRLDVGPSDGYVAVASARSDGPQSRDAACSDITLSVQQGFATLGPTPRCWNR